MKIITGSGVDSSSSAEWASGRKREEQGVSTRGVGRQREGGRGQTGETDDVASVLDDGDLETEADSEVRDLLLASPLGGGDHALSAAKSKASGDQDTAGVGRKLVNRFEPRVWGKDVLDTADCLPCGVELLWPFVLRFWLEIRSFYPLKQPKKVSKRGQSRVGR